MQSHFNKWNASVNHTAEIWAVKLCSVTTLAMRPNKVTVTLRFSLFGAHSRPNYRCVAQVLKEGKLLTSRHLIAVIRKGRISLVHAVASNRTRWKRHCEWWNFALFCTFVTFLSMLGVIPFNCWQLWRRAPLVFRYLENRSAPSKHSGVSDVFSDFGIFEQSQMRGRIRKLMCWQILVHKVNDFLPNCL